MFWIIGLRIICPLVLVVWVLVLLLAVAVWVLVPLGPVLYHSNHWPFLLFTTIIIMTFIIHSSHIKTCWNRYKIVFNHPTSWGGRRLHGVEAGRPTTKHQQSTRAYTLKKTISNLHNQTIANLHNQTISNLHHQTHSYTLENPRP